MAAVWVGAEVDGIVTVCAEGTGGGIDDVGVGAIVDCAAGTIWNGLAGIGN